MSKREPARRPRPTTLVALVVAGAALAGVLGHQSLTSSSFSAASPLDIGLRDPAPDVTGMVADPPLPDDKRRHRGHPAFALGEHDGAVPVGVTVFDDEIPAVAKLEPALLRALQRAATDAADDDVEIVVESGWRSREYQEQLLREAIAEYGSEKEAARWVATPDTSAHVSGDAVDIGPANATAWLSKRGAQYGLCQVYRNEPWHYELRPEAINRGCPRIYADPTHDPRMQQ
jgi:zinc D-Ala-D-Ala carboxypeptidase